MSWRGVTWNTCLPPQEAQSTRSNLGKMKATCPPGSSIANACERPSMAFDGLMARWPDGPMAQARRPDGAHLPTDGSSVSKTQATNVDETATRADATDAPRPSTSTCASTEQADHLTPHTTTPMNLESRPAAPTLPSSRKRMLGDGDRVAQENIQAGARLPGMLDDSTESTRHGPPPVEVVKESSESVWATRRSALGLRMTRARTRTEWQIRCRRKTL